MFAALGRSKTVVAEREEAPVKHHRWSKEWATGIEQPPRLTPVQALAAVWRSNPTLASNMYVVYKQPHRRHMIVSKVKRFTLRGRVDVVGERSVTPARLTPIEASVVGLDTSRAVAAEAAGRKRKRAELAASAAADAVRLTPRKEVARPDVRRRRVATDAGTEAAPAEPRAAVRRHRH